MKVSIITVCRNSEKTIRHTIESVLAQSYSDIEYIVVDGASSDGTADIIRSYGARISRFICEPDSGIYDAMNKGVLAATGDLIGILNSDDVYQSCEAVSCVVDTFLKEDVGIVYGDLVYVSGEDDSRVIRHYSGRTFAPWKLRFGWMPPHPASFVRASVYRTVGLYKTDYDIAADYEFMVRALYCGKIKYIWLDKVLVRMRTGGVSTSGVVSSWRLNREIVKACRRNAIYTNLLFLAAKIPFKLVELRVSQS